MELFESIHCGQTIATYENEWSRVIETTHEAGSHLARHAHTHPHLAILKEGAYFERTASEAFLRLPGDEVYYPAYFVHENYFSKRPARCVNIESPSLPLSSPSEGTMVEQARQLIERGQASLSAIAKELGRHPVYVARVYRAKTGSSIGTHVRTSRLRKAGELLIRSDQSLGEIAIESGFYDQSHLTHDFAKYVGFSPGELRRMADA